RNASGNDFSNIAFFKLKFATMSGAITSKEFVAKSKNSTARESCAKCGSLMFDKSAGFPNLVGVFVDRLHEPFVGSRLCHVWVKSKVPQVAIPDGMTCYEEGIS